MYFGIPYLTAASQVFLKARSHGAFFLRAFAAQKMECVGLYDTVHDDAFLLACDSLVCAASHMIGYHTHSVRLRLRFYGSLQLVSPRARVFSCILLYILPIANVVCFCQNEVKILQKCLCAEINRHVHQRNNVQQWQRRFFVLFMAWRLQMIRRMMWIHPLNELRFEKGEFYTLYPDLRHFGPKFFNMYRMSVPKFDKLLRKISPYIEK